MTGIEDDAFSYCEGLTGVTIPDSVTRIGYYAFSDCPKLITIAIPASLNSIDDQAFGGRSNMTDLYYGGSEQQWLAAGGPDAIYNDSVTVRFDLLQKNDKKRGPCGVNLRQAPRIKSRR